MQHLVTHVITVDRPVDWASVCAMIPTIQSEAAKLNIAEPRFGRLMFKNEHVTHQHASRDKWDWNWKCPKVAVMIEGWVSKE